MPKSRVYRSKCKFKYSSGANNANNLLLYLSIFKKLTNLKANNIKTKTKISNLKRKTIKVYYIVICQPIII